MSTPITPNLTQDAGLPSAADLDAHVADHQLLDGKDPHPQATPPAHPEVEVQTAVPGPAPDSLPNETSHGIGIPGGPTQPSIDTTRFDDLSNPKDKGVADEGFGPRGSNKPRDVMTDAERQANADAEEKKMQAGLAPTNAIDSRGAPKGRFHVISQGYDKHGMKIPDTIDTSKPMIEAVPAHVGPRGAGAPQDTFHGSRPAKK